MGIGMAYLPSERAAVGTEFEIDVRGKHRRARVETRPLMNLKV
jgi:glycine cleavage system aminomethyltransferase T